MKTELYREHTITLEWEHDEDCEAPWEHEDGHGPVSEWTRRDKKPGERVLCSDNYGRSKRYYDFAEAVKIAKRDGWDAKPYNTGTKGEQANRAAEADFEFLRRWCNDEWHWCGYVVKIEGKEYHDSCWGIDSDSQEYFETEAIQNAKRWLDTELNEREAMACRDIVTI